MENYFKRVLDSHLSGEERGRFVNLWYVMIVFNDAAITLGTVLKMSIDFDVSFSFCFQSSKATRHCFLQTWTLF